MSATVVTRGDVARIVLAGDLDFSKQGDIRTAIDEALASARAREIQVDLSNVTFMDSSVIRALLTLQAKANADGKPVRLVNCTDPIREIFVIGGFDKLFTLQ
ncbi:MAG: STAS domain-containing protein [Chloroflexota bacterium]